MPDAWISTFHLPDRSTGAINQQEIAMPKVDVMMNIIQAALTFGNDARLNSMYAQLGVNRNQLESMLEEHPEAADQLAAQAVGFALGLAGKPVWIAAIGL
jgi:hypothetical protein